MILVGPSGCGKSTALRMIAGLEDISEGEMRIGDQVVNNLAPRDRDIAMVFQNYALYPHMTVRAEHGLRAEAREGAAGRDRQEGRRGGEDARPHRSPRAQAGEPLRRPAPARRDGPRDRARPAGLPHGRAAVEPRREAARADAHGGLAPAARPLDDDGLRHARPDRGDDARRPRRGHALRRPAAGRHAAGALQRPGEHLRRGLHRLAGDELLLRRRSAAGRCSCRSRRSRRRRASRTPRTSSSASAPRTSRTPGSRRPTTPTASSSRRRSSSSSRWARRSTPTSPSRAAR